MSTTPGAELLHRVAERIIVAHEMRHGAAGVSVVSATDLAHGAYVDIVVLDGPGSRRLKVKADPYFGTDPRKVSDRALTYYRADASSFAFEAIANSLTKQPGWTLASDADDLYYYYLALAQSPEDVVALMSERDDVFFSELAVERDELIVLPMAAVRAWFEQHYEQYAPRPVMNDGVASWNRLVPRRDVEGSVVGVRQKGSIFAGLVR